MGPIKKQKLKYFENLFWLVSFSKNFQTLIPIKFLGMAYGALSTARLHVRAWPVRVRQMSLGLTLSLPWLVSVTRFTICLGRLGVTTAHNHRILCARFPHTHSPSSNDDDDDDDNNNNDIT